MWNPILNADQLVQGARIRYRIYGDNNIVLVQTIYQIIEREQYVALLEPIETLEGEIPKETREILPISTQNILRLQQKGLEIWEE